MKHDHDREDADLDKRKLNVIGEGYVLKAQMETLKELNSDIDNQLKQYETRVKREHFDVNKEGQQAEKVRSDLDKEIR